MTDESRAKPATQGGGASAELSLAASAAAPFIYFDAATNFGLQNSVASITLEASRSLTVDGKLIRDRVIVAHLRMSLPAALSLQAALNGITLLAAPQGGRSDH